MPRVAFLNQVLDQVVPELAVAKTVEVVLHIFEDLVFLLSKRPEN